MGRPGLTLHRKFKRLARSLEIAQRGLGTVLARGALELIWEGGYENGDPYLGDRTDVESRAVWGGQEGLLCKALEEAGGPSHAGFIERGGSQWWPEGEPDAYRIHDLFDHAPLYVKRRLEMETKRQASGKTISALRAEAGRIGAAITNGKRATSRQQTVARLPTNDAATQRLALAEATAIGTQQTDDNRSATVATPAPAPAPAPAQERQETVSAGKPPTRANLQQHLSILGPSPSQLARRTRVAASSNAFEERGCSAAIKGRIERDYLERRGIALAWPTPAKTNTQLAQLAKALDDDQKAAEQVISNAQARADDGDRWWADKWFDPGALLTQLPALQGTQPRATPSRRTHRPLEINSIDFEDAPDPFGSTAWKEDVS